MIAPFCSIFGNIPTIIASKTFLPSISTAIYLLSQISTTEAKIKSPDQKIKITELDKMEALTIANYVEANSDNFDFKELQKIIGHGFSKKEFTFFAGVELKYQDKANQFKNNMLIELAVFHNLKTLSAVLDNCDFKSYPDIAEQTLTYTDINQKNLLNHACRARGVIGDNLTKKIVDIYVDNLDKETLLSVVDKYIFTLPEEQFLKIANKIGHENLAKIFESKLSAKEIKAEISKYHSPDLLMKKDGAGFEKNTLVDYVILENKPELIHAMNEGQNIQISQETVYDTSDLVNFIKQGYGIQINKQIADEMEQHEFSITKKPNVYRTTDDSTLFGMIADKHTLKTLPKDLGKEIFDGFKDETTLKNFLNNLKYCKKYISSLSETQSKSSSSEQPSAEIRNASSKKSEEKDKMTNIREL